MAAFLSRGWCHFDGLPAHPTRALPGLWCPGPAPVTVTGATAHEKRHAAATTNRPTEVTMSRTETSRETPEVSTIDAAREELISRGVEVSEVSEQRPPGFESLEGRSSFAYASFRDPD